MKESSALCPVPASQESLLVSFPLYFSSRHIQPFQYYGFFWLLENTEGLSVIGNSMRVISLQVDLGTRPMPENYWKKILVYSSIMIWEPLAWCCTEAAVCVTLPGLVNVTSVGKGVSHIFQKERHAAQDAFSWSYSRFESSEDSIFPSLCGWRVFWVEQRAGDYTQNQPRTLQALMSLGNAGRS